MGMVTEWTFTKNGRKTEAQRTRMEETYGPISPDDHKKMRHLAVLLTKIAKRFKEENPEEFKAIEEKYRKSMTKE